MAKEIKQYEIGERKFWQGLASAGQLEYLWPMIVELATDDPKAQDRFAVRMHKEIYKIMSILLVPEGETRMDVIKRLDCEGGSAELQMFFRSEVDPSTIESVVSDFLALNPKALAYIMTLKKLEKATETNLVSEFKDSNTLISKLSMPLSSGVSKESQEPSSVGS